MKNHQHWFLHGFFLALLLLGIAAGTATRTATLPDSADKTDFYNLIDTLTFSGWTKAEFAASAINGLASEPTLRSLGASSTNAAAGSHIHGDGSYKAIGTNGIAGGAVSNYTVSATAAIAYSKLSLSGSVVAGDLASGAAATNIGAGGITNGLLAASAVTGAKIASATIGLSNMGSNSVDGSVIVDGSVSSAELSSGAAVVNIGAGGVTNGLIGAGAVTGAKIANATITTNLFVNSAETASTNGFYTMPNGMTMQWGVAGPFSGVIQGSAWVTNVITLVTQFSTDNYCVMPRLRNVPNVSVNNHAYGLYTTNSNVGNFTLGITSEGTTFTNLYVGWFAIGK